MSQHPRIGLAGVGRSIDLANAKAPFPGGHTKSGVLLYSITGPAAVPFQGGIMCLDAPRPAIFHPHVWHAGGINHSDNARVGCTVYAVRSWMKQRFDYPRMVTDLRAENEGLRALIEEAIKPRPMPNYALVLNALEDGYQALGAAGAGDGR